MTGWGALAPATATGLGQAELQGLEALLERLGFAPGPVDGVADEGTRAAIGRYQVFAVLSGPSEPTMALLRELRAVEAALAALRTGETARAAALDETPDETSLPDEAAILPARPAGRPDAPPAAFESRADRGPGPASGAAPAVAEQLFPEKPEVGGDAPEGAPEIAEVLAALTPYKAALASGELLAGDLARRFNRQGRADYQQALYERAIVHFGAAIHLDPGFAAAFHNRGIAFEAAGRRDLAAEDLERAFKLGFGRLELPGSAER